MPKSGLSSFMTAQVPDTQSKPEGQQPPAKITNGPTCMPVLPKTAREEGFDHIAFLFESVGKIEKAARGTLPQAD